MDVYIYMYRRLVGVISDYTVQWIIILYFKYVFNIPSPEVLWRTNKLVWLLAITGQPQWRSFAEAVTVDFEISSGPYILNYGLRWDNRTPRKINSTWVIIFIMLRVCLRLYWSGYAACLKISARAIDNNSDIIVVNTSKKIRTEL